MIKRIKDIKSACECDSLLTKLILNEKNYDNLIDEKFVVKNYFKNVIQKEENILLAYSFNNIIIGYIYLKPISTDNENGYLIDGLYVEKEYRNKGYATDLIKEALHILSNYDIGFIDINVMYDNVIAKKLYNHFGFNEFKVQMRKNIKK